MRKRGLVVAAVVVAIVWWLWPASVTPDGVPDVPPAVKSSAPETPGRSTSVAGGGVLRSGSDTRVPEDIPVRPPADWAAISALEASGAAFANFDVAGDADAEVRAAMAASGCDPTISAQGRARVYTCGDAARGLTISVVEGSPSRVSVAWKR